MHLADPGYCAFYAEGHEFVFDDAKTWQFVFVTLDGGNARTFVAGTYALAQVDGQRHELFLGAKNTAGVVQTRRYRSTTDPRYAIDVTMREVGEGWEHTEYVGDMRVVEPSLGPVQRFFGDCGV